MGVKIVNVPPDTKSEIIKVTAKRATPQRAPIIIPCSFIVFAAATPPRNEPIPAATSAIGIAAEVGISLITKNKAQSIIIAAVTPAPTAVPTNMGLKYRLLCSFFLRFDI